MTTYLHKNKKNSFTRRSRLYSKLGVDIWGKLAIQNKRDKKTILIKRKATRQLSKRIRTTHINKRKKLYKHFNMRRRRRMFIYHLQKRKFTKRESPITRRSHLRKLGKALTLFYLLRKRKTALRKLFRKKFLHPRLQSKVIIETRLDVLLLRLSFVDSLSQARHLIRYKKIFILHPRKSSRKFFSAITFRKPYFQVPLFHFITLNTLLALKRKTCLLSQVYSKKMLTFPPQHLLLDYKTMVGLLVSHPRTFSIRYPFPGNFSYFRGIAAYL